MLPKGSKSADPEKESNVIHIKATASDKSINNRNKGEPEKHQTTSEGKIKKVSVVNDFEAVVNFKNDIAEKLRSLVSNYSIDVIKGIMKSTGVHKAIITSTLRIPAAQVDAMYENICKHGIQSQLNYYASAGMEVVQTGASAGGVDNTKKSLVKKAMLDKVISLQKDGRITKDIVYLLSLMLFETLLI